MGLMGDRKTKKYLQQLKPKYNLLKGSGKNAGEYRLSFKFKVPASFMVRAAGKAFRTFRIDQGKLDMMNEGSWEVSDLYHKQILKKVRSWVAEVEKNTRKKQNNNFKFVSQYLDHCIFEKHAGSYDVDILVFGSYVD